MTNINIGIDIIRRGYLAYQNELKKNNAMDFDDLLINFYKLITTNEDILDSIQNKFTYFIKIFTTCYKTISYIHEIIIFYVFFITSLIFWI